MTVFPFDPADPNHHAAWKAMRLQLFDDLDPAFNEADMAALLERTDQEVLLARRAL